MFKIAICDDTRNDIDDATRLISAYSLSHPQLDIKYKVYKSPEELVFNLEELYDYNLFLLDIIMPEDDGISLGKKIRAFYKEIPIVYMTSSKDYAVDAFSIYAYQYLLKPLEKGDFFNMLDSLLSKEQTLDNLVFLAKSKNGTEKIFINFISHIECRGHTVTFVLRDGTELTTTHIRISFLEYIKDILKEPRFVITHKSYVANLDYVKKLSAQEFTMENNCILPISRNHFTAVKKSYLNHISEKTY